MNTATYQKVPQGIISPLYQDKVLSTELNIQQVNYRVEEMVKKLCKSYRFEASFERDMATEKELPHIAGLVCILCRLSNQNREIIAVGRSLRVFTNSNRIHYSINSAINGAFLSASNNLTQVFEVLKSYDTEWPERATVAIADKATEKQVNLLHDLLIEKGGYEHDLSKITRAEASNLIGELLNHN